MQGNTQMDILNDADRRVLEKRKWQLEFASSIIDVCCPICGGPLFFYKVFTCGHLFCNECTEKYGESGIRINCPIDNTALSVAKIASEKLITIERTIYNLRVGCLYRNKGCKEILLLGEVLEHYRRCEFRDLIKQLEKTTEVNIRKLHKIPQFLQEDFGGFGLAAPDSNQEKVAQECLEEDTANEPEVLMNENAIHIQSHTCHFRIQTFKEKWSKLQSRKFVLVTSEFFDIDDHTDSQIMAKILFTEEKVDFFLDLEIKETGVNTLNNYKRVVIMVDQSENEIKQHVIRFEEPGFGATKHSIKNWIAEVDGIFQSIPMNLISKVDSVYVKNDEIYFKIIFTPMTVLCSRHCPSLDGMLTWTITNYYEQKRIVTEGVVQCLRSQYFYCHNGKGYRMQACLYFNQISHRNQTYLSVYLDFLRGKNDENLPELFSHETTFTVFQKNDPKKCITKVIRNDEGHLFGDRIDDFVSVNHIENEYVVNDTLSLKILVKATSKMVKHPWSKSVYKYFSVKLS